MSNSEATYCEPLAECLHPLRWFHWLALSIPPKIPTSRILSDRIFNVSGKFQLPSPIFDAASARRQSAASTSLKDWQTQYIHEMMFCLLTGHKQNVVNLDFNGFAIPAFCRRARSESAEWFELQTYFGETWQTSTLEKQPIHSGIQSFQYSVAGIPGPTDVIGPSGPRCLDAERHVALVDAVNEREHDFRAATTVVDAQEKSVEG